MNALILLGALATGQPPTPTVFHSPAAVAAKGDVKAGPPLIHTFELKNPTASTVSITKIDAGCGCLRQGLGTTVLQPGESTKLTLEVNTLTQPDGPNRWQAVVSYKSESPGVAAQIGELLLQITATLTRDITVSPPQVAFSTTGAASQTLVVRDTSAKPLTVVKAASTSTHLTVDVAPVTIDVAPRTQVVTIKLSATAPAGHRDETVVLYTDDTECPELRIPVRVLKRNAAAVITSPETVNVRLAAGQSEVSTLVQLRSPDGNGVSIASAESDHPGVKVKFSSGKGQVVTVRILVTEAVAVQAGRCTVRVRVNEPGGEVAIPVSWSGGKK